MKDLFQNIFSNIDLFYTVSCFLITIWRLATLQQTYTP